MKTKTKLLILGDAPSSGTGLARILGDVALRTHQHLSDIYEVATFGYGGCGSTRFPFPQYVQENMQSDWLMPSLPQVWNDFAGDHKGILLSVWDVSRLSWLSQPKQSELLKPHPELRKFLMNPPFRRVLYTPVDGAGPNGRLTFPLMKTLLGFDKIVAYGEFGERIIRHTISDEESRKRGLTSVPHGIDREVFYQDDRSLCRRMFLNITQAQHMFGRTLPVQDDELLVGIVATNQARKDFALGIEAFAQIAKKRKARLWIHSDAAERHFSIPCLLLDHGVVDQTLISLGYIGDEQMAQAYSACDCTLGIGPEGFGYPSAESLACGTPVVTGEYGGQADFVPPDFLITPSAYRHEGIYGTRRPVFDPESWAIRVESVSNIRSSLRERYYWDVLWQQEWEPYLRSLAEEQH